MKYINNVRPINLTPERVQVENFCNGTLWYSKSVENLSKSSNLTCALFNAKQRRERTEREHRE